VYYIKADGTDDVSQKGSDDRLLPSSLFYFVFFFIKGCQSRPSTFFLCTERKRKKEEN
jgi:hypothetical protein